MPVEFVRRTSGNGKVVGILHSKGGLLNKNLWGGKLDFSSLDPFYVVTMGEADCEWLPDQVVDGKYPQWNDEKYSTLNAMTKSKDETRLSNKLEKVEEASARFRRSKKSMTAYKTWLEAQTAYIATAKAECGKEVKPLTVGKGSRIDLGDDAE